MALSLPRGLVFMNNGRSANKLSAACSLSLGTANSTTVLSALPTLPFTLSGVTNTILKGILCIFKNGGTNIPSTSLFSLDVRGPTRN